MKSKNKYPVITRFLLIPALVAAAMLSGALPSAHAQNFQFNIGSRNFRGGGTVRIPIQELTKSNKTKFQEAVLRGDVNDAARYVDPSFVDDPIQGRPPILLAAARGNTSMVRLLANHGASVRFQANGRSLASVAAANGHDSTARELVRLGGGAKADTVQKPAQVAQTRVERIGQSTSVPKTEIEKQTGVELTDFGRKLFSGAKIVPAKYERCDECNGTGRSRYGGECPECDGSGYIRLGPIYRALTGQ